MGYTGTTTRIPLGGLGLVTDFAPTDIPPNALTRATNITFVNGTVQKAPGTHILNSTPLPAGVISLVDWRPDINTQRTVAACSNGSIYLDKGTGDFSLQVPVATGLTNLGPNSMFLTGGNESAGRRRKLFFLSFGENQIKVLNQAETAFADIANPSTDWATNAAYPRCGVIHRNRLWVFSGQLSYASNTADYEDFVTNALFNPVYPGEGDVIRGAYVFKGRLFVFKDGGFVYWLNDTDTSSTNWYWQKIASNFGLSAPNAVCEALDDMLSGNTAGTLTSYSATQTLGNIEAADIFRVAKMESYLRANTSKVGITEQHCLYYSDKKQFFMTYRAGYSTYNNMMIVLDMNNDQSGPRITFNVKGTPQCLAIRQDINKVGRPMYGDKDGYVHFMDYEDRLEGAASYTGEFQTVHFDMSHVDPGLAGKNKVWDFLEVTYAPEGNWNLSCDYFVDGKYIETLQFPMDQYQKPQLDVLLLDTDRLAQFNTETFRRPLKTRGRTISFRFYNSGANQSFQVANIVIGFRASGDQSQNT